MASDDESSEGDESFSDESNSDSETDTGSLEPSVEITLAQSLLSLVPLTRGASARVN